MAKVHRVRKGYDLKLIGSPSSILVVAPQPQRVTLYPEDFKNFSPKLSVKEGDRILAGDAVFYAKADPSVLVPSPVSGIVARVVRGEKRVLQFVEIAPDAVNEYRDFGAAKPSDLDRAQILEKLKASGVWSLVQMRPYGVVAKPGDQPKAVFVNSMDTAPHAPHIDVQLAGREQSFLEGMEVVKRLSDRTVLTVREGRSLPVFESLNGVEIHLFSGPHPSGNASLHIQQSSPLNKSEVIWTLTAQDVCVLGELFLTGTCRLERVISLTGSGVREPKHIKVLPGSALSGILANQVEADGIRIISGNVLTGVHVAKQDALHYYHHQIATLPEGDQPDFLGWLLPGFGKFSLSRTFFSWLTPSKTFALDTNMHGEQRNFVMTGQYDRVFPFDIYPLQLLKAMWASDIDKMEQLGIYEVVEEDFALCEVICTSKQPLQELVREALDTVYTEMN